jgi:uncharacterized protein (DUF58 family)
MPLPTWRLALAAALGSVAVALLSFAPVPNLVIVNAALLGAALVDLARTVPPGDVRVRRELPGVLPLDAEGRVTWTVRNPSSRPITVTIADELVPSLCPERRGARLRVPPGGRVRAGAGLRPSRRGRFVVSEVAVRVEGPWGLVARQARRSVPATLRVYPPFHSRDEAELRINRARILEVGLRSAQGRGSGTEFDSLREYSVDDEYRRIDWAATARAAKPIVRTYRAERNQTVLMLLDTGRVMAGRVGAGRGAADVPRLDHAMDAVMMLTAVSTRLGDRAGLVAFSDRLRATVGPGHTRGQLSRVTEAMYALEPELVESDYLGAFTATLTRFRRRALLVVLTELIPEAVTETLLPALPLVVRSHLVLIGAVRDPSVERWVRSAPAEASAAFRKAAAAAALTERRTLVTRLRALGAVVVDEPPGRLAPRLADAYLKVKATGRL